MVIMSFIHRTLKFESRALLFEEIKYYFARGGEKGFRASRAVERFAGSSTDNEARAAANLSPARLKSSRRRRNARPADKDSLLAS